MWINEGTDNQGRTVLLVPLLHTIIIIVLRKLSHKTAVMNNTGLFLSCFAENAQDTGGDKKKKPEGATDRLIGYLKEKSKTDVELRREEIELEKEKSKTEADLRRQQLELERDRFEAAKEERQGMLAVMRGMMDRLK